MKKVINTNIGGVVFPVESDAYTQLEKYLSDITTHFQSNPESEEIIMDIEANIAEKFMNKKRNTLGAVNNADVWEIITQLGNIQDLQESDDRSGSISTQESRKIRKLYRNTDDAILGGVCSGIASYFSVDPVIIRIILILLTFAGGSGILAYIILWIIVPKAKTASQKLQMQGAHPTISSIQKYIGEKIQHVPAKSIFHKIITFPIVIVTLLFRILKSIFPTIRVVSGIIISSISGFIIFILSTVLMGFLIGSFNFQIDSGILNILQEFSRWKDFTSLSIALYISILIPLLLIFFGGIYLISQRKLLGLNVIILMLFFGAGTLGYSAVKSISYADDIQKMVSQLERLDGNSIHIVSGEVTPEGISLESESVSEVEN